MSGIAGFVKNAVALKGTILKQWGLDQVDNTSDVNKPVSTIQQAAIDKGEVAAFAGKIHHGAIVAACFGERKYFRKLQKQQRGKSYYNETCPAGVWKSGGYTTEAAARAAGGTTGDFYQNTTDGKFYSLNAGSGVTEIFRGVRDIPARPLAVAETGRVVIYDADKSGCPMWMVGTSGTNYAINNNGDGGVITSLAYSSGKLVVGRTGNTSGSLIVDFAADMLTLLRSNVTGSCRAFGVSKRNTSVWVSIDSSLHVLVNNAVNAVAATVLPGAPIDPATGLPKGYRAAGTDGNGTYQVSVIKPDDTVVNVGSDSSGSCVSVWFEGRVLGAVRSDGTVYVWNDVTTLTTGQSADHTYSASSTPALLGTVSKAVAGCFGSIDGATFIARNPATQDKGMIAQVSKDYPGMWQIGAVKCCLQAGASNAVTDRSVSSATLAGTRTTAIYGTSDRYVATTTSNNTCTLDVSVANGSLAWVEQVSGVLHAYTADIDGSGNTLTTGTVDGVSGSPSTSVTVASGTALTVASGKVVDCIQATAMRISADQAAQIARELLAGYQAGASGTLAGSSSAVVAVAYDSSTKIKHIASGTHRSGFVDLARIESEASPTGVGTITTIAVDDGAVFTGGSTGAYLSVPAVRVRDIDGECERVVETPVPLTFVATSGQTTFTATKGYKIDSVIVNNIRKRLGADYTISSDGYKESAVTSASIKAGITVVLNLIKEEK